MLPKAFEIILVLLVLLALGPAGLAIMERVTLNNCSRPLAADPRSARPTRSRSRASRSIRGRSTRGDLFWALRGERHDGHSFAAEAARRGAVACVASSDSSIPGGLPAALVADTIQGLKDFARWYRQRRDALVVGVTGTRRQDDDA